MRSIAVIINPVAGAGRQRISSDMAQDLLRAAGFDPEILITRMKGDATELAARIADRHPLVAVIGGDGTISEAAQGLVGTGTPLVLIPAGSGNDFAYDLGIKTPAEGIRAAAGGRCLAIDVCSFANRQFINTCGLFFDGEVSLRAAGYPRRWGKLRYSLATASLIGRYAARSATWRLHTGNGDAEDLSGQWLLTEVGNGRRCGGGFQLTPQADPADGLLDFCMVREMSWFRFLGIIPRGINGSHLGSRGVVYRRVESAHLGITDSTAVHWDGEADRLPPGEYAFSLQKGALQVMVPFGAPQ